MARKRGKRWMADVRLPDGTRLRPTFATEEAADRWTEEAKKAITEGKPLPPEKSGLAPGSSNHDSLETLGGLLKYVEKTEWAFIKHPLTAYRNGKSVTDYLGANKLVRDITSKDIAQMRVHFAEQGLTPSTANKRIAAISKMLRVAADIGVIDKVPTIKWNRTEKTKFRFLDETEEQVMLAYFEAAGDLEMRDLCILLIDSGARCYSEMLPVGWDAFGPNFSTVSFWDTKTNQPRTVPLTKRCREILQRRKDAGAKDGPFRGRVRGVRGTAIMGKDNIKGRWQRMRDATGLSDVTPHTLRHTCCTRLVLGGVDIKRVMTWMGHSAITTTMRYMQIKPSSLEEVLHVLESGAHKGGRAA